MGSTRGSSSTVRLSGCLAVCCLAVWLYNIGVQSIDHLSGERGVRGVGILSDKQNK